MEWCVFEYRNGIVKKLNAEPKSPQLNLPCRDSDGRCCTSHERQQHGPAHYRRARFVSAARAWLVLVSMLVPACLRACVPVRRVSLRLHRCVYLLVCLYQW